MTLTLTTIERALRLSDFDGEAAQTHMQPVPRPNRRPPQRPGQARLGAVLILLYSKHNEVHLILTRRRDDLEAHAGQISLPGGSREGEERLEETALRETMEEVGVPSGEITVIGSLTPLYIYPSDFEVHPFVGWHAHTPVLTAQLEEVAEIIEVPLSHLLAKETRRDEVWEWRDRTLDVPFYMVDGHKVWGATAMMLGELMSRIRLALDSEREMGGRP